ncbi:MAG: hypothetical protein QM723_21355 [Myxococcaceae bacterium]
MAFVALWAACSGSSGCGGCSCLTPLPNGFQGTRLDGSLGTRVTQDGFDFINANFSTLLPALGVSNPVAVPVACTSVSFGSDGHFCDQNKNSNCDPGEQCDVTVDIVSLQIEPEDASGNTGLLTASAQLQIKTGDMWLRTCAASVFGACICHLTCSANFDSTRANAQTDSFSADVNFTIDSTYGNILAFNVSNINGINTLDSDDLDVNTSGFCSALACSLLDIGFIKSYVVDQFVKPQLQSQITKAIDGARCRKCGSGQPSCPAPSTCSSGVCQDSAGACVPTLLGVEGRLDLSSALATLGGGSGRAMDIAVEAGGSVSSKSGSDITIGLIGGAKPVATDTCVPAETPLPASTIPAPDWSAGPSGYHVGIAIAGRYLDEAGFAVEQSGGLCLQPTAHEIAFLDTDTLGFALPSLKQVANHDGKSAPMMMVLRPHHAPSFRIGSGAVDPVTHQPTDPLITMTMNDLSLDFYALLGERQARLFTIETDVVMPISLVADGCDKLTPAVGDLSQLIKVKDVTGSEILSEDKQTIESLVGFALQLAGPSLTSALGGFSLPDVGGFKLEVNQIKGITPDGAGGFSHVGIFATLLQPGAMCPAGPRPPRAHRVESHTATPKQWREAKGHVVSEALVTLDPSSLPEDAEVSWRVDGSLWSPFIAAANGSVRVVAPQLVLQGKHTVELRTRSLKQPWALSRPLKLEVLTDTEEPSVTLARGATGGLTVHAHDRVTPPEELQMAVRLGDGALSDFGPVRELTPDEADQGVELQLRDRAGNVATVRHGAVTRTHQGLDSDSASPPSTGCSAFGAAGLLPLALLVLRRRRRLG